MSIRRIVALSGSIALLLAGCATDAAPSGSDDQASATSVEAPASDIEADEASDEAADAGPSDGAADDDHEDEDGADGAAAADDDVDRVVEVDMEDIAFSIEELEFTVGERVRFDFVNVGQAPHEALIGDLHVQEEHEQEMAEGADHDEASDDGHEGELTTISLEPGESGSFVHEFTESGELWMGCHVPGHWGAGMRTRITVTG